MTKIFALLFLTAGVTAMVSCSSDDGAGAGDSGLSKAWKIDGRTFNQAFTYGETDEVEEGGDGNFTIVAVDETMTSYFAIMFPTKPTSNGTYNLLNTDDHAELFGNDNNELAANQAAAAFIETVDEVQMIQEIKTSGAKVVVTVSNGKITADVSEYDAHRYDEDTELNSSADLNGLPVVKVQGNMVETDHPGMGGRKINIKGFKFNTVK
ncbi:MAG: hypothetical protein WCY89_00870 [Flavobacteriaceae bacterium]